MKVRYRVMSFKGVSYKSLPCKIVSNRHVLCLFGVLILLSMLSCSRCYGADHDSLYRDAYQFYEQYGTSQMVFHEGCFYYGSRGSTGDSSGTRYAVCGQRFAVQNGKEEPYACSVALQGDYPGSCKRISYITRDGYRYSLYQISYDRLFQRFQAKYPSVDFSELLYNHELIITADFCLCLNIAGEDQGRIVELDNGKIDTIGKVYHEYEGIAQAAEWSSVTMEALKHYFNVSLKIYQPSIYWVRFEKNHSDATGSMERQQFTYGERQTLEANEYQLVYPVSFCVGKLWEKREAVELKCGYGLKQESCLKEVGAQFLGWSKTSAGSKSYENRQEVRNLTNVHQKEIVLYGLWQTRYMKIPDFYETDLVKSVAAKEAGSWRCLEFLGWSREELDIFPVGTKADEVASCLKPGEKLLIEKPYTLYGVWAYGNCVFRWEEPARNLEVDMQFSYSRENAGKIRGLIKKKGYIGKNLLKALQKGHYV